LVRRVLFRISEKENCILDMDMDMDTDYMHQRVPLSHQSIYIGYVAKHRRVKDILAVQQALSIQLVYIQSPNQLHLTPSSQKP
jgi:hypothetical protein